MVAYYGGFPNNGGFEINGVKFKAVGDQTTVGRVFYSYKECLDYAYGRESVTTYYEDDPPQFKEQRKINKAIPLRKKDLKY